MKIVVKYLFSILLVVVLLPKAAEAQSGSLAYDAMLHGMYSNTVPIILADTLEPNNYLVLDAREPREFEVSHLPGAKWVGYDTFNKKSLADLPKDTAIVVYCTVGYRSERIGEKLEKMGFTNVKNLYGGIFQWVNEDKHVVDMNDEKTEKVHAYSKAWGIWLNKGEKVYK